MNDGSTVLTRRCEGMVPGKAECTAILGAVASPGAYLFSYVMWQLLCNTRLFPPPASQPLRLTFGK